MGLREYLRKRDFGKTPEPKGETSSRPPNGFSFVVLKHAATRLHSDFRLELDGLLSWAVPKGPKRPRPEERFSSASDRTGLRAAPISRLLP